MSGGCLPLFWGIGDFGGRKAASQRRVEQLVHGDAQLPCQMERQGEGGGRRCLCEYEDHRHLGADANAAALGVGAHLPSLGDQVACQQTWDHDAESTVEGLVPMAQPDQDLVEVIQCSGIGSFCMICAGKVEDVQDRYPSSHVLAVL